MRVFITDSGSKSLKNSVSTVDLVPLTYSKSLRTQQLRKKHRPGAETDRGVSLPRISSHMSPSIHKIQVRAPQIGVSRAFQAKYSRTETSEPASPLRGPGSNTFLTLAENPALERLIRRKLDQNVGGGGSRRDLAEVEYKYQKVLERHEAHMRHREQIFRGVRRRSQEIEQAQTEEVDRIQDTVERENESYIKQFRETLGRFRRKERVLKMYGLKYAHIWDAAEANINVLAVPKQVRAKFVDIKRMLACPADID